MANEKPDAEDFDDEFDSVAYDGSLQSILKDFDSHKRKPTGVKGAEPAWRRLERLKEQRATKALTEDFEDFDL